MKQPTMRSYVFIILLTFWTDLKLRLVVFKLINIVKEIKNNPILNLRLLANFAERQNDKRILNV